MAQRIIYVSGRKYIAYKNSCLEITDKETGEYISVPLTEIGLVVVDSYQTTISAYAMGEMAKSGTGAVFCDDKHSPISTTMPIYSASVPFKKIKGQLDAKKPSKKRLWKDIVESKIRSQVSVLERHSADPNKISRLKSMLPDIRFGDNTNREGAASGIYFRALFGESFRREREGDFPNNILNFTYMVTRAGITRAIIAAGLSPMLGIHHKNNYNPYTLSDDLIEPYRPLLDSFIMDNLGELLKTKILDRANKAVLFGSQIMDVSFNGQQHSLQTSVTRYIESFYRCLTGKDKKLLLPSLCP